MKRNMILTLILLLSSHASAKGLTTQCGVIGNIDGTRFNITICLVHTSATTFCLRGGHSPVQAANQETAAELSERVGKLACVSGKLAKDGYFVGTQVSDDVRCHQSPTPIECN